MHCINPSINERVENLAKRIDTASNDHGGRKTL
ncbi:hypothetical protein XaFJ1_GM002039 [Xanthomonas albilineans]|nr:hypothetical protein XaFJ1_GM002039 [Xanthomonas albilineans]